jgi:hypothetical protein
MAELSAGIRDALHASLGAWNESDKTLDDLHHSVGLIAKALDLPMAPTGIIIGPVATKSTTVIARQNAITVDAA